MRNIGLVLVIFFALDWYMFFAVKANWHGRKNLLFIWVYWLATIIGYGLLLFSGIKGLNNIDAGLRNLLMGYVFILYVTKFLAFPFYVIDDIRRLISWISKLISKPSAKASEKGIKRSEFINKVAIFSAGVPFFALSWGTINGAYNYRVRRATLYFENLPKSFDGYRIVQLSDIHSGSLSDTKAVQLGIDKVLAENPDVILFTGDLVNNKTDEVYAWMPILDKLKAPDGVYSVLGNHDYGDYHQWESPQDKIANLDAMYGVHKKLGWQLLNNANVSIEKSGERIAILGVENWGNRARFPKYGKLNEAVKGTEKIPFKILLSHDPSHWDAQIRPEQPTIDLTFSGHTHGMQFGIEIPGFFKWSPVSIAYPQWAGLYQNKNQYLYVNRGFGFIGYPGRVGIMPEITVITLKHGKEPNIA